MKQIISYAIAALMLVVVFGCSADKKIDIDLKGDEAIAVDLGQVLDVNVEANPTTGYAWSVAGEADGTVLKRTEKYNYKQDSDRIGSGGVQIFSFEAIAKGQTKLVFEYSRSWEKEKEPAKKYTLKVKVR